MNAYSLIIVIDALIFNTLLFLFLASFIRKHARREEPMDFALGGPKTRTEAPRSRNSGDERNRPRLGDRRSPDGLAA